jgi:hypothetical protein
MRPLRGCANRGAGTTTTPGYRCTEAQVPLDRGRVGIHHADGPERTPVSNVSYRMRRDAGPYSVGSRQATAQLPCRCTQSRHGRADVTARPVTWRGPRTAADPLLTGYHWRVTVRNHWKAQRLPCAVCRKPIDYDGPRYYLSVTGRRTLNPRYLVVGHIVSRYTAKRYGWTEAQINALSNTRPECQACSNRTGAKLGQKVQRSKRTTLNTSRRW